MTELSPRVDSGVDNTILRRLSGWLPKIEVAWEAQPCWKWRGYRNGDGYGIVRRPGSRFGSPVHRVLYEILVGPFDSILHLDHLCRVRACVCPWHLDPVTRHENGRRTNADPDFVRIHSLWRERVDNVLAGVEAANLYREMRRSQQACGGKGAGLPAETGVTNISTSPSTSERSINKKNLGRTPKPQNVDAYANPDALVDELYRERYER